MPSFPLASGAPCPNCGTLVTLSGASTDPVLNGFCPIDGTAVSVPNTVLVDGAYIPPDPPPPPVTAPQSVEIAALQAQVAELQAEVQKQP